MDRKIKTITIGLPSINEYQNLKNLVPVLLKQKYYKSVLKEVVVLSDGSTDNTKNLAKEIKDKRLKIIVSKNRHGKPYQINKLFARTDSDYIVLLDADIALKSQRTLLNLTKTAISNSKCLVSGLVLPKEPKNFIQKVAYAGVHLWDKLRLSGDHSEMYLCEGSIRCFPKSLYKKLVFPKTSADEAFSYIESLRLGFGFKSCRQALACYTLPKTLGDYYRQQRRYSNSQNIQQNNFKNKNVNQFYSIKTPHKLFSLIQELFANPIYTIAYLIFILFVKISLQVSPAKTSSKWQILKSTK